MERLQNFDGSYHSCVIWNIENYFKSMAPVNALIESPPFVTNLHQRIKWRLAFIARGEEGGNYVTKCILRRSPSCTAPDGIFVTLGLIMMDSMGNWLGDSNRYCYFLHGEAKAITTWDIYDVRRNEAESTCFFTGNIRIICSFRQESSFRYRLEDMDQDLWNLTINLKDLYISGDLTDLNLKVGEKTFSVHSFIVKVRSPKVRQMLNVNPSLREIDLTDFCSVPMMEGLIEYWYTGDLDKLQKVPTFSSAAVIRSMEQLELSPYFDPEYIKLNNIYEISQVYLSWRVSNTDFCGNLRQLERNIYYAYTCDFFQWILHIYPNGIRGNANFFTIVIIQRGLLNATSLELFLIDENNTKYFWTHKTVQNVNARIHTFCKFVAHDDFASVSGILLKHNNLRIGFRMNFDTGYVEKNSGKFRFSEEFPLNRKHPYINFANDMKHIFEDKDKCDVFLKTGDQIFKVHSAFLATRSRYFASVFRNREYETGDFGIITLDDVEPDDLEKILKYLYYAEKIVLNTDLALKLYPVVSKYGLPCLESVCSDYLQNNISVENALNIVELADTFSIEYLKETAQYVVEKNWDQISQTETWNRLLHTNEELASDIIRLIEKKIRRKHGYLI